MTRDTGTTTTCLLTTATVTLVTDATHLAILENLNQERPREDDSSNSLAVPSLLPLSGTDSRMIQDVAQRITTESSW
jgi:hypothetical protein